jgi:hypothetical protein
MLETETRETRQTAETGQKTPERELTAEYFETVQTRQQASPIPRPIPIPTPIPWLFSTRFMIWKQDPSVRALGRRLTYMPRLVLNGPRDARINTDLPGTTPIVRNATGDFIYPANTPESDCAHTFAIVRQTLTLYERVRGGAACRWAWNQSGNTDPVTARPRGFAGANAFYSRNGKSLSFGYFTPSGSASPIYTCRSLDITAHETGHAILDGLKPGWLGTGNVPQTGGLHESFGDLTAIFLALSQLDQVEAFIAMTRANLHNKNFLAELAEEFGTALGRPTGLRNADNDLKLSQVSNEVHAISQVFTGGIYDVLADIFAFEKNRQSATKDPAQVLLEVNQHVCKLLVNAIIQAPDVGATYSDVVNRMLTVSNSQGDPAIYRTFIRNRFTYREVVVSPTPLTAMATGQIQMDNPNYTEGEDILDMAPALPDHASLVASQDRSGCCGTMKLPEYAQDQKKLDINLKTLMQEGQCISEEDMLSEELAQLSKEFK